MEARDNKEEATRNNFSHLDNESSLIKHEVHEGVFLLIPTAEEWEDFPALLQQIRALGADKPGICKIQLPKEFRYELSAATLDLKGQKPRLYHPERQANDTFKMIVEEDAHLLQTYSSKDNPPALSSSTGVLVQRYEELLNSQDGLQNALYYIDMDARTPQERARLGLPERSPIWPLKGDRLQDTINRVPGIHWPYTYRSAAFGASFTNHIEDFRLLSINYLYEGEKIWYAVAQAEAGNLETRLKATNPSYYRHACSQFLRHAPTTVPSKAYEKWDIKYHIARQLAGEAIVTFPNTYHQGFNLAAGTAEAVNYGDEHWEYDDYHDCVPNSCPAGFVTRDMLGFRAGSEEQHDLSDADQDNGESEASDVEDVDSTDDKDSTQKSKATRLRNLSSKTEHAQKNSRKRRLNAEKPITDKKATRKQARLDTSNVSLKLLEQIPQNVALPETIFTTLMERTQSKDQQKTFLLTRLFFAIASPDAFADLKDACCATSSTEDFTVPRSTESIDETVEALDRLDSKDFFNTVLRRHLYALLLERRIELTENFQKQKLERATRRSTTRQLEPLDAGFGRGSSVVLSQLMKEAYPNIAKHPRTNVSSPEYSRRHTSKLLPGSPPKL